MKGLVVLLGLVVLIAGCAPAPLPSTTTSSTTTTTVNQSALPCNERTGAALDACTYAEQMDAIDNATTAAGCDQFSTPAVHDRCTDNYYYLKAMETGNATYCGKLQNASIREECASALG